VTGVARARRFDIAAHPFQIVAGALAAGLLSSTCPPAVTVALAAALGGALLLRPRLAALAIVLVLVGAVVGDARLRALDASPARVRDARVDGLRVHLLSALRPNPFGASAAVGVAAGRLRGVRLLMRVARWTRLPPGIEVGAELAADGQLRTLRPDTGSDFAEQLRRGGIAGELVLEDARATGGHRGGVAGTLDAMRRRAEGAVAAGLPPPEAALARGMVSARTSRSTTPRARTGATPA
jgi:competence protein ComEC